MLSTKFKSGNIARYTSPLDNYSTYVTILSPDEANDLWLAQGSSPNAWIILKNNQSTLVFVKWHDDGHVGWCDESNFKHAGRRKLPSWF